MACGKGDVDAWPSGFPVTNSATAWRSAVDKRLAIAIMGPDSMAARTRSGVISFSVSRLGMRSAPES
jgi:hypothetical protein